MGEMLRGDNSDRMQTTAPRAKTSPPQILAAYATGIGIVAGGVLLAVWAQSLVYPSTVVLATVVIAAWFGGLGPGLVAAFVATVAIEYFFISPGSFEPALAQVPRLIIFLLLAVLSGWGSAARRRAEESLKTAYDEMEARVRRRTAELQRTNEQLHAEIAERRRAEGALEDLAGRLIHAQEAERSRIGRELHDHVSQMLGVLAIKIDHLRMNQETTPRRMASALDDLRRSTSEITEDVHRLSHRLHSSTLDYLGVVPALQKLVAEFTERYGIAIGFTHEPLPLPLSSDVALCLYRVAEESLTNVAKHSQARSARLRLLADNDGIRLTIEDDGRGFDAAKQERKAGLGFVSMHERLRVVHGTIRVDSAPSRGTTIDVWVPAMPVTSEEPNETFAGP
jgi:signal transduction histidine kinase